METKGKKIALSVVIAVTLIWGFIKDIGGFILWLASLFGHKDDLESLYKWIHSLYQGAIEVNQTAILNQYGPWVLFGAGALSLVWINFDDYLKSLFKTNHATEQEKPTPDWMMSEAIKYVINNLFPDKEPSIIYIDTEDRPACEAIIEKVKSGDLQTWGKRIEIKPGIRNFKVNIDQEPFSPDDWKHRELLPLVAGIPTQNKPQTKSIGRNDDQIQFTDLYVNESEIKSIRWDSFVHDFDAYAAIKDLERKIDEYKSDNWVNSVEKDEAIERAEKRIEAIKINMGNV